MRKFVFLFLLLSALSLYAKQAMDFEFYNLKNNVNGVYVADEAGFTKVSKQFASVMAPAFFGEAATFGMNGFELGLGYSMSTIDYNDSDPDDPWLNAFMDSDGSVTSMWFYNGIDFHMRKGLPYGFAVFANARYYVLTEMISGGLGLELNLNEGFKYLPEFSFGFGYNRLFGTSDLNMDMFDIRIKLSKVFPIAGEIKFVPSLVYNHLFVSASSERLGGFWTVDDAQYYEDPSGDAFYFKDRNYNIDRMAFGLKLIKGVLGFNLEGIYSFNNYSCFTANAGFSIYF